jgi:hypothetical protein
MNWSVIAGRLLLVAMSPIAQAADGEVSVEHGQQVSITHGCHDCHTAGYLESEGKLDPWGTTYALNLRLTIAEKAKTRTSW